MGWFHADDPQREPPGPGQASVMFLPMIDTKPTNMTCVNSILHFLSERARRYGATPVLTFGQPLWWKATTIIVEGAQEDSPLRQSF